MLKVYSSWKSTNKSIVYLRNVINRFAYPEHKFSSESLEDDMIEVINSISKVVPQTLYEVPKVFLIKIV